MRAIVLLYLLVSLSTCDSGKESKYSVEIAYETPAKLGEGAIWNHKTSELFWVDILDNKVHVFDPESGRNRSFNTPTMVGTVVPDDQNKAVIALVDGVYLLNLDDSGISLLSDAESEITENRFNDGKCDPNGNLWVGSMHMPQSKPNGNLYRIDKDGKASIMRAGVTISNGIVWSSDAKTMYYIDTPTQHIKAFDYDLETSAISNERIVVEIDESLGSPDGMTIDSEDMLWVGMWNGNAVARFDPQSGKLIDRIEVPAHNVTSCAFGDNDLGTLYITTANIDMTDSEQKKYPKAGSIFKVRPGVYGLKANLFGVKNLNR